MVTTMLVMQATAQQANTLRWLTSLAPLRMIAQRVQSGSMSMLWAVRLHRTVYHVMQESTVQEAAQVAYALATVRWVGTRLCLISLVLEQTTA